MNIYIYYCFYYKQTFFAKMSTSQCDASAHLAGINATYAKKEGRCLFAYTDTCVDKNNQYIVINPDGTIKSMNVSGVTDSDHMRLEEGVYFDGIALKYISPSTNVQETITALDESPLVAELRQAMAEGKFAPIIMPSSK